MHKTIKKNINQHDDDDASKWSPTFQYIFEIYHHVNDYKFHQYMVETM